MRILLLTLALLACQDHEFGSRVELEKAKAEPTPIVTTVRGGSGDATAKCAKSCKIACGEWSAWSAYAPAPADVCSDQKFPQTRESTRTCSNVCQNISCKTRRTDKKENVSGTKTCPQPLPCQTVCDTACSAWSSWSAGTPAANTECKDKTFTQTSTKTRTCPRICDDSADCLCEIMRDHCLTSDSKNNNVKGIKVVACADACGAWIAPSNWSSTETCPANTSFTPTSITETGNKTRACTECGQPCATTSKPVTRTKPCAYCKGTGQLKQANGSCVCNTNKGYTRSGDECICNSGKRFYRTGKTCTECPADKEFKQLANGTWQCAGCPAGQILKNNKCVCPAGQKLVNGACCNTTCAAGCDDWNNWSSWSSPNSCSTDTDAFTASPASIEQTRSRARACLNLCANITCFTSNNETNIVTCTYCQGEGQTFDTGGNCVCDKDAGYVKVGNKCVCDSGRNFYKQGNSCVECVAPEKLQTQTGGAQLCVLPKCNEDCDPFTAGDWTPDASTICKNNKNFKPKRTWTRTCPTNRPECETTKVETATTPIPGTRVIDCEEACKVSQDWFPLPPAANSICQGKSEEISQEQTLTCTDDCGECPTTKSQKVTVVGSKAVTCDSGCVKGSWSPLPPATDTICEGQDTTVSQKRTITCTDDCGVCPPTTESQDVTVEGTCKCNYTDRYYLKDGNTCTKCPTTRVFNVNASTGTGTCTACPEGQTVVDNICKPTVTTQSCTTCAECDWGDWSDWSSANSCPANDKFEPASITQTRARSRTCNLCADVTCFTSNSETNVVTCAYCQGEGQDLLEDGTCICDHKKDYYLVGDACVKCKAPKELQAQADGTQQCVLPDCDKACKPFTAVGEVGVWKPDASTICPNTTVTQTRTLTRTCPDNRPECETTMIDTGASSIPGTKETNTCTECTLVTPSDWSGTCPSSESMKKPTQRQSKTSTRVCDNVDCPPQNCADETEYKDCPWCEGEGQKLLDDEDKCVCKSDERYYRDGDKCTQCPTTSVFNTSAGTCTACPEGQTVVDNACVIICPEDQKPNDNGDGCVCKRAGETIDETTGKCIGDEPDCSKCRPFPEKWTTQSCPSKASFKKHKVKKQRQRSRTCPADVIDAMKNKKLDCALVQIETEFCPWCQGEGQKLDGDGVCVCKAEENYYRDGNKCKLCMGIGKIIDSNGNCVCNANLFYYLEDEEDVCKVCPDENKPPNSDGTGCECKDSDKITCTNSKIWDSNSCRCVCNNSCAPGFVRDNSNCGCTSEWSTGSMRPTLRCLDNVIMGKIIDLKKYWKPNNPFPKKDRMTGGSGKYKGYRCSTLQSLFSQDNYAPYYHAEASAVLRNVLSTIENKISNEENPCHDEGCEGDNCATAFCTVPEPVDGG